METGNTNSHGVQVWAPPHGRGGGRQQNLCRAAKFFFWRTVFWACLCPKLANFTHRAGNGWGHGWGMLGEDSGFGPLFSPVFGVGWEFDSVLCVARRRSNFLCVVKNLIHAGPKTTRPRAACARALWLECLKNSGRFNCPRG